MTLTNKVKKLFYSFRREVCIFIVLFLSLLCSLPTSLHEWNSAWYVMDYSLGFDSRLFIGSLLRLFHPDYLSADAAYTFVLFSILVFLLLLSYILGYALRQIKNHPAETGLLTIIVFYMICPGSPAYLWSLENIGRFDLYLLLLTLIAATLHFKVSSPWIRLISFVIIGLIALSIHQAFMFIFFPLLFTLYMDTMTENHSNRGQRIFGILSIACLAAVFIYFQLFSHINIASLEDLSALLSGRTDLAVNEVALGYEYFASTASSIGDSVSNQLGERIRYGAVTVFLLAPLLIIYGSLWFYILKAEGKRKFKYWMILLSQLCFVPAFLLTIDWGRWFGAWLTVLALQIVVLAAKKDALVLAALAKLSTDFRRHPYLFMIAGIWLASLNKFQATLLPDAPTFFASLYRLYSTVF